MAGLNSRLLSFLMDASQSLHCLTCELLGRLRVTSRSYRYGLSGDHSCRLLRLLSFGPFILTLNPLPTFPDPLPTCTE